VLIDIRRILASPASVTDGKITIGAGTVHHDVATSSVLKERCPVVSEAAADDWRSAGAQSRSSAAGGPTRIRRRHAGRAGGVGSEIHLKGPKGWRGEGLTFSRTCSRVDMAPTRSSGASSSPPYEPRRTPSVPARVAYAIVALLHRWYSKRGKIVWPALASPGPQTHASRLTSVGQALVGRHRQKRRSRLRRQAAGQDLAE